MSSDCLFCKIRDGQIPAKLVHEDEHCFAFRDINPQAATHVLVIPERHVERFHDIGEFPAEEAKRMLDFVAEVAAREGLSDYRVVVNAGAGAGQTVFHLHWHVLGGQVTGLPQ